jgi:hypothetical protein
VAQVGSKMMITYSDVLDSTGTTFPGLGNANVNALFTGIGATPQDRYTLRSGSPALTLSEPDANGQRGPIGFTAGSSNLSWGLNLSMLQNPADLHSLNFVLTSTIPLMAPPYVLLKQYLPDTTGYSYTPIDSAFMQANGPGVYILPFSLFNINAPCSLSVALHNITNADTLMHQWFIASNLSGTYTALSLGDEVILSGRAISGEGVWGIMPEIYTGSKPLGTQLQSVSRSYQVLTTIPNLAEGRVEFKLTPEMLAGRQATHCAVARWSNGSWQPLTSILGSDLSSISAPLYTGGTYRVVWGQNLGSAVLPAQMELSQNYPNPFNPETTIRFSLPQAGQVRLQIFDILGRQVISLLNEQRAAGYHQVVWSGMNGQGSPVASGIYFYRLQMGGKQISKKMILLR